MTPREREQLLAIYRDGLLNDTLPFWLDHCIDREHGGFMFCLDRDGAVVDTDKGMWTQGRLVRSHRGPLFGGLCEGRL